MKEKLFNRNFTLLILGQVSSLTGNLTLKFALSMYILERTGSASLFAGLLAASMVPTLPLSPSRCILAARAAPPARIAADTSGLPFLNFTDKIDGKIGQFDAGLVEEFLRAFAFHAGINVFVRLPARGNRHHEAEAVFKALAKCLQDAVKVVSARIPSSKGVL